MRTIGQLPAHELLEFLREYGYSDEAKALDGQMELVFKGALPFSDIDFNAIFKNNVPAWKHTGHAFGYIPLSSPGKKFLSITHAGNIRPDIRLKHERITIRLDTIGVADYPGKGLHHILFGFQAQNHINGQVENIFFNQTYKAMEGQTVGIIGYPIFVGLNVGNDGVSFECSTFNAKNEKEETLIEFLDSEIFKNGLKLANTLQPAIAPLSATAVHVTKLLAGKSRNVAVQNFYIGLDFSRGPGGARLAEGLYFAIQIPENDQSFWKWDNWVYSQSDGKVVNKSNHDVAIPYNYISLKVSRYKED